MEQWKINTALDLIEQASRLESRKEYLQGRVSPKRKALASLYKKMMNIGAGFPDLPPVSSNIVKTLNRKKDDGCPACVKTRVMASNIDAALSFIRLYAKELDKFVTQAGGKKGEVSVHDLEPDK